MPVSKVMRRGLLVTAALLCSILLGIAAFMAAVDAGYFRGAFVAYLARATGRKIEVTGSFRAHLLSLHPSMTAGGVTIGNPRWTPSGVTAHIDALQLGFDLPRWGHPGRIESLQLEGASLTLYRDAAGHANWQRTNPDEGDSPGLPLIAGLAAAHAQVTLDDERRHLKFDGVISAQDAKRPDGAPMLQIQGTGQLNGRPVRFDLAGDALAFASHDHPYRFSFSEDSSGSHVTAQGSLPKPFDFNYLDTAFEASGADLNDLYFLSGVSLVNTGAYKLTGHYSRDHDHTQFNQLHLITGKSDVSGTLRIEVSRDRPNSIAKLHSQVLRAADFGLRAAGRDTATSSLLLSTAALNPDGLRRGDGVVDFDAHRVEIGRQVLQTFAVKLTIDHGLVTTNSMSADFLGGKLSGQVKLDATQTQRVPIADVDIAIAALQLAQLPHKSADPPFEGALAVRLKFTGRGVSVHDVAAAADGTLSAQLPHGVVRSSLAELAGMDLRGLGLTLEKSTQETAVRCAAANFIARAGVLTAQRMILDTEPVLINGAGSIHMETETLDLVIRGEPKSLRVLRLKAPLSIRGTLANPTLGIEQGDSKLILVDLGRAKDVDCAALVQ